MLIRSTLAAAAAVLCLALPALAHEDHPQAIHVHDAYARVSPNGTGAVFFMIHNNTETDDKIIGAATDVAEKAELHTHIEGDDGVMKMAAIEGGVDLPYGEMHEFARGGDHIMLMGLKKPLADGDTFTVTLILEHAGEVSFDAVVDNARKPGDGMGMMDHSGHGQMQMGD